MNRKTLLLIGLCIFILALLLFVPVSASTTTYVNDTFDDSSGIESSTNVTVSGGDVNLSGPMWHSNSSIVNGLPDVNGYSKPEVFYMDGIWYLIYGEQYGGFQGFNWTGSAWQDDNAIENGLPGQYEYYYTGPDVFQKDGIWYLISGNASGNFIGFNWTGTTWQSDTAIVNNMEMVVERSTPTVFNMSGVWRMISGKYQYTDPIDANQSQNWTGSAWQYDTVLASGLDMTGRYQDPTVFQKDGVWYAIQGREDGDFRGFNWSGSTWQSDTVIVNNLGDIGGHASPTVFQMDDVWYLITGSLGADFYGFSWGYNSSGTLTSTTNTTSSNIINVTPTITETTPPGTTITYDCSNDNGTTWESVSDSVEHTFSSTGNQFKWRAKLTTTDTSITPTISDVSFEIVSNTLPSVPTHNSPTNDSYVSADYQILDYTSTDSDGDTIRYKPRSNHTCVLRDEPNVQLDFSVRWHILLESQSW